MQQLFALSLGIAAMFFAATHAPAQSVSAGGGSQCAPRADVVQALAIRYGETRQAIGLAAGTQLMEIFASERGSWTITASMPNGTTCLVASGESFEKLSEPLAMNDPPA
jgi:hypothetical protein